ncbi:hypothetical protein AZI86_11290 [Bdellovibrio bacteriovorus]|uniref:ATP-grasp domain-containing protein n=1 Tax=Bdellovibrio bacteriovorus TaxID=959 RepID=A0A150WL97_BDEBC|nr:hypothetical protein [Bdellovibrio bacteriovorus]KYG64781.1 hypothetical protein AZI86_11290 [Bdellovibrio bacteriovorus]
MKSVAVSIAIVGSLFMGAYAPAAPVCARVFSHVSDYSPVTFLNDKVNKVEARILLENQSADLAYAPLKLKLGAKRDDLMGFFYDNKIVEFSETTHLMADKLIMAKILQKHLGDRFLEFHPPTMGVKEFLAKNKFVNADGKVIVSKAKLSAALDKEFPQGFIIKPTLDWSSSGKSFYKDKKEIVDLLMKGDNALYNSADMAEAFGGNKTGRIGSGEKLMMMGMIEGTGLSNSKYGEANEFRAHAFYGHVVKGATETRWYTPQNKEKIEAVDRFVEDLLQSMPKGFSHRMGFSFDIFVTPQGKLQIIEVNTNRGERTNWSGFLRTPKTIGAYARHVKDHYGWAIEGTEGWMFYNNLANAKKHVKHDIVDWMKDAANPESHDYALEGFRMMQKDYFAPVLENAKDPVKLQSADFVELLDFAQNYSIRLSKVKKIGDKAWNDFVTWTKTLEH